MKKSLLKTIVEVLTEEVRCLKYSLKNTSEHNQYMSETLQEIRVANQRLETQLRVKNGIIERQQDSYNELRVQQQKANAALTMEQLEFLLSPTMMFSKKIEMIKYVRATTKIGLKEAKEYVEELIETRLAEYRRLRIIVEETKTPEGKIVHTLRPATTRERALMNKKEKEDNA